MFFSKPSHWKYLLLLLTICSMSFSTLTLAQQANQAEKPLESDFQYNAAVELYPRAWQDPAYGLTLDLPLGAEMAYPIDDRVLTMYYKPLDMHFNVWINIDQSTKSLQDLRGATRRMIKETHQSASFVKDVEFSIEARHALAADKEGKAPIAKHPAMVYYYADTGVRHDEKNNQLTNRQFTTPILICFAVIAISPQHFMTVRARGDLRQAGTIAPTFEAIIKSLKFDNFNESIRERTRQVKRMAKWQNGYNREEIKDKLIPVQLFQTHIRNKDTAPWRPFGYLRLVQKKVALNPKTNQPTNVPSYLIFVEQYSEEITQEKSTLNDGTTRQTSLTKRRLSRRNHEESYDGRTSIGDFEEGLILISEGKKPEVRRFNLLVSRTGRVINTTGGLSESKDVYSTGDQPYISQGDRWILHQLLPHDTAATYGYYWLDPLLKNKRVVYRSDSVTPIFDVIRVVTHVTHSRREEITTYDREGRIKERLVKFHPTAFIVGQEELTPSATVRYTPINEAEYKSLVEQYKAGQ